MYEDDKETKKKVAALKKGGKPLGGKLLKIAQQLPREEAVKNRHDMRGGLDNMGEDGQPKDPAEHMMQMPKPKMRTIKVIGKNGQ
jgi:hypothetical protein